MKKEKDPEKRSASKPEHFTRVAYRWQNNGHLLLGYLP